MKLENFFPEYKYGFFTRIDGTLQFYTRINALVGKDDVVVDIGCGRGKQADDPSAYRGNIRILKGKCKEVIGVDVDPVGMENEFIDQFRLIESERLPLEDDSVDILFSDWTLEHIEKPDLFFSEIKRVLKKGGKFALRTSNKLHYVSILASLIPNRLHSKVTNVAQEGRKEEDVFPTYFACNTRWKVRSVLKKTGLAGVVYQVDGEPSYLQFNSLAFRLGLLIRALTPQPLKHTVLIFGEKP